MSLKILLSSICTLALAFAGCQEADDLAIDRVAAPLVSTFVTTYNADSTALIVQATFYELDKSGILDQQVGIDSIPVPELAIAVYTNETTQLSTLTTNTAGEVVFEQELAELEGISVLEWAGTYRQTPFRIRQSL